MVHFKKLLLVCLLIPISLQAKRGFITGVTFDSGGKKSVTKHVFYAKRIYKQGGIVFKYPQGMFSLQPAVNVSLLLRGKNAWKKFKLFSPIITINNKSETKIRVNKLHNHKLSEAGNYEVMVYIWAVEP